VSQPKEQASNTPSPQFARPPAAPPASPASGPTTPLDPAHPLALAMRAGKMGFWWRELTQNRLYWSRELESLYGFAPGTAPATRDGFMAHVHPEDRDRLRREVDDAVTERRDFIVEFRFRRADENHWRWMEGRGHGIYEHNRPTIVCGIGIDITERRRAEETIRENARQLAMLYAESEAHTRDLERANRDLSDFAHIAAHDLKEPFRTINFQIGFVLEDHRAAMPPAAVERLEAVQQVALRGTRLLDALMRFARSGEVRMAQGPVNLGTLAKEAAASLGPALASPTVELTVDPEMPEVVCDPVAMQQVFVNLISNAARYSHAVPRRVRIYAREGPYGPQVCVEDNGVGIPEARRKDAFRIFKRLHREEEFGPGSGVGLAIVKKVIEAHRGEVTIEDTPGGGTTFVISLPRARFV